MRPSVDGPAPARRWATEAYDNGLDCFADTYTVLLSDLGADPRILGDDWGYSYGPVEPDPEFEPAFMRVHIRRHEYGAAIRRWYGAVERCISHPDPAALWQHVRQVLDDGQQVVVQVDTFADPNSLFYQRIHYVHRIVIAGWRRDEAYVVDERPGRSFRGWMSLEKLNHAAGSTALAEHYPGVFEPFYTVDLPRPAAIVPPPEARLREVLLHNIEQYLVGSADPERPVGHHAARRFVADVRDFAESAPAIDDRVLMRGVSFLGSLAKQRRQNALFIELAGNSLGGGLTEVATQFREISYRLDKLRAVFFFGASAKRPTRELLGRLADKLAEMFADEHRSVRRLDQLVAEHRE